MLKRILNVAVSGICLILAVFCVIIYFRGELNGFLVKPEEKILIMLVACVFTYLAARFTGKEISEKSRSALIHTAVTFAFIVYSLLLVNFLFFEPSFGRSPDLIFFHDRETVLKYLDEFLNLDIGSMVYKYAHGYMVGNVSFERFFMNVIGNFIMFMPFAFFLPLLFEKQKKFIRFFLTVTALSLFAEIMQIVLLTGTGDIDDVIMNSLGACLFFALLRTPPGIRIIRYIKE